MLEHRRGLELKTNLAERAGLKSASLILPAPSPREQRRVTAATASVLFVQNGERHDCLCELDIPCRSKTRTRAAAVACGHCRGRCRRADIGSRVEESRRQ